MHRASCADRRKDEQLVYDLKTIPGKTDKLVADNEKNADTVLENVGRITQN